MKPDKEKELYGFYKQLIVRFPFFAYIDRIDEATVRHYLQTSPVFREALYLASPGLLDAIKVLDEPASNKSRKKVRKLLHALCKYLSRMSSRPTPFGLFAGCSVINWGAGNEPVVLNDHYHFHTRLDMGLLCVMYREIIKVAAVRKNLNYTVSGALYNWNGYIRYNAYLPFGRRQYLMKAVQETGYLNTILEKCGNAVPYHELARYISDAFDATPEEAAAFLDELIDEQLIQSDIEPGVSGEEYWFRLAGRMKDLSRMPEVEADPEFLAVFGNIMKIDRWLMQPVTAATDRLNSYNRISSLCRAIVPKWEEQCFQVDLVGDAARQELSDTHQQTILDGIYALSKLSPRFPTKELSEFIALFSSRYEDQEIPLLEALDPESGIGYSTNKNLSGDAPLIRNFFFNQEEGNDFFHVKYTGAIKMIMAKMRQDPHAAVMQLKEDDLFGTDKTDQLPPTFSVIFRMLGGHNNNVYLEHCGWPTGACMIGRFAHAAPEINHLLEDINKVENKYFAGDIVAEVCHLPEDRFGNVVTRPSFREYEIPIFSGPQALNKQIYLNDLMVSVKNGQVILRSRRHNKRVIPRLSNAHNYSLNALPVYQFLGDLQNQDVMHWMGLNLEVLPLLGFKHVPRITYKQAVLSLETWFLDKDDLAALYDRKEEELDTAQLEAFLHRWKLPERFVWAEHDHELMVNTSNPLEVAAWLESCKNKGQIILKEHPFNTVATALNGKGEPVSSQFVTILYRRQTPVIDKPATAGPKKNVIPADEQVKRRFTLGDEWLYYKIYCGVKTGDNLVANHLLPLCRGMEEAGILQKWFFIRYTDPDFHIRLRLHFASHIMTREAIQPLHDALSPLLAAGYIWKVQTDTYVREIERYGNNGIQACESLFYHDSMAVASLLGNAPSIANFEEFRWLWALRSIDTLLTDFQLDTGQKLELMNGLKTVFQQEFDSNALTIKQLADRYRFYKNKIQHAVAGASIGNGMENLLLQRSHLNAPYTAAILSLEQEAKLEVEFNYLLSSIIHMSVNRTFKAQQRAHELLIYDFMYNYYKSRKATAMQVQ